MIYKYLLLIITAFALLTGCSGFPPTAAVPPVDTQAQAQVQTDSPVVPQPDPVNDSKPVKKVYLTFDDGPNSHYTGLVLDVLKKYGVKATFVVVGSNIERNPGVFTRILEEGHHVVNHTYSHDYKRIYASPQAFLGDLERCSGVIASFTGEENKIFRAPGGPSNLNKKFYDLLSQHGYKSLGWNVASADTDPHGVSPEQIINNVKNGVLRVENANRAPIILMHDGAEVNLNWDKPSAAVQNFIRSRESGVAALPVIIEFLQDRGYTFAGVDENTPPAW